MVTLSRIPLFGLPHKVDVIRKSESEVGGIVDDEGTEVVLYTSKTCRISLREQDNQELQGSGFSAANHRKVVMEFAPKIQDDQHDFLRIPWGTPPNQGIPAELADDFAPQVIITTPAGSKTLIWDATNSRYADSLVEYRVFWTGTVWRFEDDNAPLTHDFTGFLETQNIFFRPWDLEVGAGYLVTTPRTGATQDYKIIWRSERIDDFGADHHTGLVIELEDTDA